MTSNKVYLCLKFEIRLREANASQAPFIFKFIAACENKFFLAIIGRKTISIFFHHGTFSFIDLPWINRDNFCSCIPRAVRVPFIVEVKNPIASQLNFNVYVSLEKFHVLFSIKTNDLHSPMLLWPTFHIYC